MCVSVIPGVGGAVVLAEEALGVQRRIQIRQIPGQADPQAKF